MSKIEACNVGGGATLCIKAFPGILLMESWDMGHHVLFLEVSWVDTASLKNNDDLHVTVVYIYIYMIYICNFS